MFGKKAKLTALSIVHIFETSKPFGERSAVAVLNDGAGISYGVNQFTHRSGSLLKVCRKYITLGGKVESQTISNAMKHLEDKSPSSIATLSKNTKFKSALKKVAETNEMKNAQDFVSEQMYLKPAIDACVGSGFVLPLSLAVVFDSINHGSFGKIRDKVTIKRDWYLTDLAFEKSWIARYCQKRDEWLESIPRLKSTDYRTDFFLAQIQRGNWNLDLPMNVHGYKLTEKDIPVSCELTNAVEADATVFESPHEDLTESEKPVEHTAAVPQTVTATLEVKESEKEFTAYIPQIERAKTWLQWLFGGLSFTSATAYFTQMPNEIVIALIALVAVVLIGGIIIFALYHKHIFEYVRAMNTLRANPQMDSPNVVSMKPE